MSAALIMREAFEGHPLTFVEFNGEPVVVARELAAALGYADSGALARLIRAEWSSDFVEGQDFHALRGDALGDFKRLMTDYVTSPIDPRSPSLLVLTESGWWQVAQRTDKAIGVKLRRFLTREVLPKLARGEGIPGAGAQPNELAEHFERLGDKAAAVGDKVGAGKFYRAAGEARGLTFRRARRVAAPPDAQLPLLPATAAREPAPADDWTRFVALWRERYGTTRATPTKLLALAVGAGLFRTELAGRTDHGAVTKFGRILRAHVGSGVARDKSGEWSYRLA